MANIYRNIFIHGLPDILDDRFMYHKTRSGNTILDSKLMSDKGLESSKRKTPQDALREASTYASFANVREAYVNRARRSEATAYSIAFTDWFSAPRVLEIDVDAWTGEAGQTIRVKARDHVRVTGVYVVIRDAEGNVLEMGEAIQSAAGSAWWEYTTRSRLNMTPFPIVEAIACNPPGHQDSFAIS